MYIYLQFVVGLIKVIYIYLDGCRVEVNGSNLDVRFIRIVAVPANTVTASKCNKYIYKSEAFPFKSSIGFKYDMTFNDDTQNAMNLHGSDNQKIKFGYQIMYRMDKQFQCQTTDDIQTLTNITELIPSILQVSINFKPFHSSGFITSLFKVKKLSPWNFNKVYNLSNAELQVVWKCNGIRKTMNSPLSKYFANRYTESRWWGYKKLFSDKDLLNGNKTIKMNVNVVIIGDDDDCERENDNNNNNDYNDDEPPRKKAKLC